MRKLSRREHEEAIERRGISAGIRHARDVLIRLAHESAGQCIAAKDRGEMEEAAICLRERDALTLAASDVMGSTFKEILEKNRLIFEPINLKVTIGESVEVTPIDNEKE